MNQRKSEIDSSERHSEIRQREEVDLTDSVAAKKILKADREKVRRDRLNEQFQELGSMLDPDRHKNDKSTILADTIQSIKDLDSEVNTLQTEHAALCVESRELIQEKNELREEKSSLKSDIENLKTQYQQIFRLTFPWAGYDPSLVMAPPFSLFPVPLPIAPGSIPVDPAMQPYPFIGSQPGFTPHHCSHFIPHLSLATPQIDQPSTAGASPSATIRHDPKSRSSNHEKFSNAEKLDSPNDVMTDLELRIPGSSVQEESSRGVRKGKQPSRVEKNHNQSGSSSLSSSQSFQGSSSNSVDNMRLA